MAASGCFSEASAELPQSQSVDLPRQHIPDAGQQMVRFINEQGDIVRGIENPLQVYGGIKDIIVVTDHKIGEHAQGE